MYIPVQMLYDKQRPGQGLFEGILPSSFHRGTARASPASMLIAMKRADELRNIYYLF